MSRVLVSLMVLFLSSGVAIADGGAFLGVHMLSIRDGTGENLGHDGRGAFIARVVSDSPADAAGMKDGDIIIEFEGEKVAGDGHLKDLLGIHSPGDNVEIKVLRDGDAKVLKVELSDPDTYHKALEQYKKAEALAKAKAMQDTKPLAKTIIIRGESKAWLGVKMQDLTAQLADHFGVEHGILISEILKESPAEKADLQAGDVLIRANETRMNSPNDLSNYMSDAEPGDKVAFALVRSGKEITKEIELGETPEDHFEGPRIFTWRSDDEDEIIDIERILLGMKSAEELPQPPQVPHVFLDRDVKIDELKSEMMELKELNEELLLQMEKLREEMERMKAEQ